MVFCYLCLQQLMKNDVEYMEIYSDAGLRLEVSKLIATHFWMKIDSEECLEHVICMPCWDILQTFHKFYLRIADAHNYFVEKNPKSADGLPLSDKIGLKCENSVKESDLEIVDTDFFVTEVKVEVQDLELLPPTEVIEETLTIDDIQKSGPNLRSSKKSQCSFKKSEFSETKLNLFPVENLKNECEPEVLLTKTETNTENSNMENDEIIKPNDSEIRKRRRGRPRKVKDVDIELKPSYSTNSRKKEKQSELLEIEVADTNDLHTDIKVEENEYLSENEFITDPEFLVENIGTEDSESSSSESDMTEESWHEPKEQHAEIPIRKVVKPKKYRKREKSNAPRKKMSREEIDRKRALQAEYDETIAKFFVKFACPICNLLVSNFGTMKAHFRASHKDETGYMSCCGRKFHLRKKLAEHVLLHWNPDQFKCNTCSKVFQDSRALENHSQSHLSPQEQKDKRIYQCDKCPKSFTTKPAFEYHSVAKHVPKSEFPFSCPVCNKKVPTSKKLKDHMKYAHDPESTIICDKCGKQMRNQYSLKKHHEIEHSDKPRPVPDPMQCSICLAWLRHAAGLKQHMKTIHEESGGEHRCHICNKTSSNARALKRHIYHNHECERKFKCTMCEKAFKRPQDLREHTSTHTGEVLYTCPNCPMTFFSNANMYKHRQRLHREEWEADRKKPTPPNIMGQAISATAAMKMKQAVGAANAFFAGNVGTQSNTI